MRRTALLSSFALLALSAGCVESDLKDRSFGEQCGDSRVDSAEMCDDGNTEDGDGCSADCMSDETCGNGVVDAVTSEACDDGNTIGGDGCQADCTLPTCGDGVVDEGERCDEGADNGTGEGTCSPTCMGFQTCGDGVAEGSEDCDDSGESATCNSDCTALACGDGLLNVTGGETCDDGNGVNTDACPDGDGGTCLTATCGDGFVRDVVENCDDGAANGDAVEGACAPNCVDTCSLTDNGLGMSEEYCAYASMSIQSWAELACESHWGDGMCCVITGGYNSQQYGLCGQSGNEADSYHWHWDNHPTGHCPPTYVVGDVVAPGWCGSIIGSFLPPPPPPAP